MNLQTPSEMLAEIKQATKEGEIALAKRLSGARPDGKPISQPTVNRILRGQPNCSSQVLQAIQRVHAEIVGQAA